MKIYDIIWLEEVEDKIILKHSVQPVEAEEVLLRTPYLRFMSSPEIHLQVTRRYKNPASRFVNTLVAALPFRRTCYG